MKENIICIKKDRKEVALNIIKYGSLALMVVYCAMCLINPAFAVTGEDKVKSVLESMIDIIGLVFQAVGVVLSVYSVGQLVLAFKNEDADSKSRASTMLVVGVVLIALPAIISGLGLLDMIGGN